VVQSRAIRHRDRQPTVAAGAEITGRRQPEEFQIVATDSADLSVQVDHLGPHPVVRLSGDVDLESAPALTETLRAVLDTIGTKPLVLDLTEVEFMDSSGLGVLVGAHQQAAVQGSSLILAGLHPRVAKILRITKLHKVFTVVESVDEAIAPEV
jgi:anti-sigma B factor antagonist